MSDVTRIGKWLTVERVEMPPTRRTGVWRVLSEDGECLGLIGWYGRWRQHTFDPEPCTTYHNGCLRDIAAFLDRVNADHRRKIRQRKELEAER